MIHLRVGDQITHVKHGTGVVERCDDVPEGEEAGLFGDGRQRRRVEQQHLLEFNPSAQTEWVIREERVRKEQEQLTIDRQKQQWRKHKERERKLREEAEQQWARNAMPLFLFRRL